MTNLKIDYRTVKIVLNISRRHFLTKWRFPFRVYVLTLFPSRSIARYMLFNFKWKLPKGLSEVLQAKTLERAKWSWAVTFSNVRKLSFNFFISELSSYQH
jgi:hypothetical protein